MLQATGEAAPEEAALAAPLALSAAELRPAGLDLGVAKTEPRDSAKREVRVIMGEAAPEAGAELLATETLSALRAISRWLESRSFSASATMEAELAAAPASGSTAMGAPMIEGGVCMSPPRGGFPTAGVCSGGTRQGDSRGADEKD